ncbi:MAG TPA: molybdenum cofactor biosynthesis protein MoaE [Dehalococcoidia bacterium]|nr:molybdenum cofactor biosynthesis protein MoaE [Dehalococcoidia bacterium]
MIKITDKPLSPERIISEVKTHSSGCALSYVGLIRDTSYGKQVASVEYGDPDGTAEDGLRRIADELKQNWELNAVSIYHRIGKLNVGDINLVIAISSAHRSEAFAACQHAVDLFKEKLPTTKVETYMNGSTKSGSD